MMRRQWRVGVLLLSLAVGLPSCSKPTDNPLDKKYPDSPTAAQTPASLPTEQIAEGQLQSVDMDAKTFILKDPSGNPQVFSFSDNTETIGIAGTQGLSGGQGSHASVRYVEQGNLRSATRIEIVSSSSP